MVRYYLHGELLHRLGVVADLLRAYRNVPWRDEYHGNLRAVIQQTKEEIARLDVALERFATHAQVKSGDGSRCDGPAC